MKFGYGERGIVEYMYNLNVVVNEPFVSKVSHHLIRYWYCPCSHPSPCAQMDPSADHILVVHPVERISHRDRPCHSTHFSVEGVSSQRGQIGRIC